MSRFLTSCLVACALAMPASAMTFSLPDLSFSSGSTTVSTQSCVETQGSGDPICK